MAIKPIQAVDQALDARMQAQTQVPRQAQAGNINPQQLGQELQRMATNDNSQATPQINAGDIDVLAFSQSLQMKLIQDMAVELARINSEHVKLVALIQQLMGAQNPNQPQVPPTQPV